MTKSSPIPQDKCKKWIKNLKNDTGNSDFLKFDDIAVSRDFYEKNYADGKYYPHVYYGINNGIYCLIIVQADINTDGDKKKVVPQSADYYIFEAGGKTYTVGRKEAKDINKNWKKAAKGHKIKVNGFTIPKENWKNIFADPAVSESYFFIGEDTDETNEYYKIKPLMSGQKQLDTTGLKDDGPDPDPPSPTYNDTFPCPPTCDQEPGD